MRDEFLSPAVVLTGFGALKRVCHTCCDPTDCVDEGTLLDEGLLLPAYPRRAR